MTIVASWLNREPGTHPTLWTVTDSRLSAGSPILDCGAKLFSIRVTCLKPDSTGFFTQVYYTSNVGMAFAGSSLIALNLQAFLNFSLGNLVASTGAAKPSIKDIALHASAVLKSLLLNYASMTERFLPCEVTISGFCPCDNDYRLYHLRYTEGDCGIEKQMDFVDLNDSAVVHLLGEHKQQIQQMIIDDRHALESRDLIWWRSPKTVIQTIINDHLFDTIGGGIQLGITHPGGFQLMSVCRPIVLGEPQATIVHQNIDLGADNLLMRVGNCTVGTTMMT